MVAGVYKIVNLLNGHFYIGSSKDISQRFSDHKSDLRNLKHRNRHLENAWHKYGAENFQFEIVEETLNEKEILLEREQYYLDTLKPEYNISKTADAPTRGMKQSPEWIAKRFKFRKELDFNADKNPNAKLTWEIVNKLRETHQKEHLSHKDVAKKFGLSQITVTRILRNKSWHDENYVHAERNTSFKIDFQKAEEIRAKRAAGASLKEIIAEYDITRANLWLILTNKIWVLGTKVAPLPIENVSAKAPATLIKE